MRIGEQCIASQTRGADADRADCIECDQVRGRCGCIKSKVSRTGGNLRAGLLARRTDLDGCHLAGQCARS